LPRRASQAVISIPATVHGAVHVSGAARLDTVVTRPDASRLAYVTTTLAGGSAGALARYGVTVGPAPAALTAHVAAEAINPPQPIRAGGAGHGRERSERGGQFIERIHPLDGTARTGPRRHRSRADGPQRVTSAR
jgi:hypothetical protein